MRIRAGHIRVLWVFCLGLTTCFLLAYCSYSLTFPRSTSYSLSLPRPPLHQAWFPLSKAWAVAGSEQFYPFAKTKEDEESLFPNTTNNSSAIVTKTAGVDVSERSAGSRLLGSLRKVSARRTGVPLKHESSGLQLFLKNASTKTFLLSKPITPRPSFVNHRVSSLFLEGRDSQPALPVNSSQHKASLGSQPFVMQTKQTWTLTPKPQKRKVSNSDHHTPTLSSSPFLLQRVFNKGTSGQLKHKRSDAQRQQRKLILFYNMPKWFPPPNRVNFKDCPVHSCLLTSNRSLLLNADAVIFHIFFVRDKLPPRLRPPGQVWVAYGMEAPYVLGTTMLTPEWSRAFNWTMTYRVDSDIFFPYGRLVYRGAQTKNYTQLAGNKQRSAAWFVSNCRTPSERMAYVRGLQKHYPVDIFGRCGSLHCPVSNASFCTSLLNSTYRFYLSFENSLCSDYVTEKFFRLFQPDLHVIPVVRGGSQYRKFFPWQTFVDASEFTSPAALGKYLKKLESDTDRYAAMLREKDKYYVEGGREMAMCELCEKLHSDDRPKTYPNIARWLSKGVCRIPKHSHGISTTWGKSKRTDDEVYG